jgi:ATP-dependent RNA helicase SUPV3L1/SUV3
MEAAERINRAGVPCDMITGEEERTIVGARHVASTIEMLAVDRYFDVAVIDEAQMIVDDDRGWAWTQAILGVSAPIVHVCMAEEALPIISKLILSCGDTYEVERHERQTPLSLERVPFHFPEAVRDGDALVVFSRKSVLEAASLLEDYNIKASVVYGALPYEARMAETEKFLSGKTRVVVATDAIGMGMNLPIKRIVFLETVKFDGKEKRNHKACESFFTYNHITIFKK